MRDTITGLHVVVVVSKSNRLVIIYMQVSCKKSGYCMIKLASNYTAHRYNGTDSRSDLLYGLEEGGYVNIKMLSQQTSL